MIWKRPFFGRILLVYMLLALSWWAFLLFRKNSELTEEKLKRLQVEMNTLYKVNDYDLTTTEEYQSILSKHKRQRLMIIGEGIVFGFTLIVGMGLVHRAHLQEVATANRKKNFLLSITHELKSPIAAINLVLDTLKSRNLPRGQVESLAIDALQESKRLEKQINDLLLASRMEKDFIINKQYQDLIPIIEQAIALQQKLHPQATVELIADEGTVDADIDRDSFSSIVNNLIENAIKYAGDQAITTKVYRNKKNQLLVEVSDLGPGIPHDEKPKVFDQFYRIGNEETRASKGTGLGLYIVKKVVELHNGTISISDNIPTGTTFTIELP